VSREYGFDRGVPIDRHYIAQFLAANAARVQGRTLEVGGNEYTLEFGGARVTRSEILNVNAGVPHTTFVADLTDGAGVPDGAFDCVILTQTLHLIYDVPAAIRTLHRVLKPGGTLLLTVPGTISQIEMANGVRSGIGDSRNSRSSGCSRMRSRTRRSRLLNMATC
jgi:SAM-dependent methyltransferase